MDAQRLPKDQLLNRLPLEWPQDLSPAIEKQIKADGHKVVVLDDDPTGTQTVHGLPVLTEWSLDELSAPPGRNANSCIKSDIYMSAWRRCCGPLPAQRPNFYSTAA